MGRDLNVGLDSDEIAAERGVGRRDMETIYKHVAFACSAEWMR